MTKQKTKIDNLIEPALLKVARRTTSYFSKSDILNEVMNNKHLAKVLTDLRNKYGEWKLDQLIKRYVGTRVGQALQQRDTNGIRVYECYAVGKPERRWLPLRAMTAVTLRNVMQQTRVQARQLTVKDEGYHILLAELEKLGQPNATVDDVYDKVIKNIIAHNKAA